MKKGEAAATPAATLIGVFTLLFVLYILVLPADERTELLEEENDTEDDLGEILDESPGRLSFTEKSTFDHPLPNIYLQELREAVVLKEENPFIVKNGWFSENRKQIFFTIPNPALTQAVKLSFQTPSRAGILRITLNGYVIFEGEIANQIVPPILLPEQLLGPTNTIEFSVDGTFLRSKRYSLTDVKIVAEVIKTEQQTATSTFTISNTEYDNLEKAILDFYPVCEQEFAGMLTITLNENVIYNAIPACEGLNRQDLDRREFKTGKNTIAFRTETGSYRVEQIKVRTLLEEVKPFIDYFTIKSSLYNDIKDDDKDIILRIEFVADDERKHAELNINGKFDVIDQTEEKFEKDISKLIREGNNYIEIRPLRELNVARVLVEVE